MTQNSQNDAESLVVHAQNDAELLLVHAQNDSEYKESIISGVMN